MSAKATAEPVPAPIADFLAVMFDEAVFIGAALANGVRFECLQIGE